MKLHGYCVECRRIKRVEVKGVGYASLFARGVAQGICDECSEKRSKK